MGPTASQPRLAGCCAPRILDFGGHLMLGAQAQDPECWKLFWPSTSTIIGHFTPTFSALDPASLYSVPRPSPVKEP